MKNAPCQNCSDRSITCHDGCGKYKDYQSRNQMVNEARKQANFIHEYFQNAVDRSMKIRRVHG